MSAVTATASIAAPRRGQAFADRQRTPRHGVDEQRLERPALALAGRGIGRDLHRARERRQQNHQRDHRQEPRGALLRSGHLHFLQCTGLDTAGLTPRPTSRRLPICALY